MKTKLYLILMLSVYMFTCKKEKNADATITINSPTENQQIMLNDTLQISGKVSANVELHGVNIYIKRKADGANLFVKEYHTHDETISFNEYWKNNFTNTVDCYVLVEAILDHDGNKKSSTVAFQCHN